MAKSSNTYEVDELIELTEEVINQFPTDIKMSVEDLLDSLALAGVKLVSDPEGTSSLAFHAVRRV